MDTSNESEDLYAEFLQKTSSRGAGGCSRSRLPGARSLKRVTTIIGQPLDASSKIRMTRTWSMNRWCPLRIIQSTVLIGNLHDQRRAGGASASDTCQERGAVGLDSLTGASAISTLSTTEFLIYEIDIEIQSRWKTSQDGQPAWAM